VTNLINSCPKPSKLKRIISKCKKAKYNKLKPRVKVLKFKQKGISREDLGLGILTKSITKLETNTYHDTRTHYLMEKDPSLPHDQAEVMDATAADKSGGVERKKRWALQGHAQVDPALGTPCLGSMGLET
jgi:hypothetical protein